MSLEGLTNPLRQNGSQSPISCHGLLNSPHPDCSMCCPFLHSIFSHSFYLGWSAFPFAYQSLFPVQISRSFAWKEVLLEHLLLSLRWEDNCPAFPSCVDFSAITATGIGGFLIQINCKKEPVNKSFTCSVYIS